MISNLISLCKLTINLSQKYLIFLSLHSQISDVTVTDMHITRGGGGVLPQKQYLSYLNEDSCSSVLSKTNNCLNACTESYCTT